MVKNLRMADLARFARGTPRGKRSLVKKAFGEGEYRVEQDFYKRVRDSLKGLPKNDGDLSKLAEVPDKVNEKRRPHIQAVVSGFVGWVTEHEPAFMSPPRDSWTYEDVSVPITPELAVVIDGQTYLLKLNYTALPTRDEDGVIMAHLMHRTLGRRMTKGCRMGVLDVRTGRLFATSRPSPTLDEVIQRAAVEVSALWDEVQVESV